jgi:hypothetical protein
MLWDPVWRLYRPLRGLPCDVRQWKVLDIAINEVPGALSMHVAPPAIRTIVVPAGVTLLWLHNPPRSWTGMVGPSLPDFTIAPCVDSCCAIGRSGGLSLSFKTDPESKVCVYIYTIAIELSYSSLG